MRFQRFFAIRTSVRCLVAAWTFVVLVSAAYLYFRSGGMGGRQRENAKSVACSSFHLNSPGPAASSSRNIRFICRIRVRPRFVNAGVMSPVAVRVTAPAQPARCIRSSSLSIVGSASPNSFIDERSTLAGDLFFSPTESRVASLCACINTSCIPGLRASG